MINSQPMGFYSAHTLVDDVKRAGVQVWPLDPNRSEWDCTLERQPGASQGGRLGIRVGFRVLSGFGRDECERILEERRRGGPYRSLGDFVYRARVSRYQTLEALAMGEAFACFGISQRQSLWEILAYRNLVASEAELKREGEQLCFFGQPSGGESAPASPLLFRPLSESEAIRADYRSYGLSVRGHPMGALRRSAAGAGLPRITSGALKRLPRGRTTRIAGLVIARQRPPTAKGTAFATLEDEEGFLDLILHKDVYEKYHDVFVGSAFLIVSGKVQADKAAVSLIVRKVEALPALELRMTSHDFH